MAWRLLLAAGTLVCLALLLFGLAGRVDLPFVWAYLAITAVLSIQGCLTVDEGLLRERMHPGPGGKDRISFLLIGLPYFLVLVIAPLDLGHVHIGDRVPAVAQVGGLAGYALGMALVTWATEVNRYFSSVVRFQKERGHRVVKEGPYAVIRHPGYSGAILGMLASPLALGSWLALPFAVLATFAIIRRLLLEDRFLHEELPGYREYASSVRYRLVPGVW